MKAVQAPDPNLPYDPTHPYNAYPKVRHHSELPPVRVEDPDEERDLTPSKDGWYDLKRDALDAVKAAAPKASAGKSKVSTD